MKKIKILLILMLLLFPMEAIATQLQEFHTSKKQIEVYKKTLSNITITNQYGMIFKPIDEFLRDIENFDGPFKYYVMINQAYNENGKTEKYLFGKNKHITFRLKFYEDKKNNKIYGCMGQNDILIFFHGQWAKVLGMQPKGLIQYFNDRPFWSSLRIEGTLE